MVWFQRINFDIIKKEFLYFYKNLKNIFIYPYKIPFFICFLFLFVFYLSYIYIMIFTFILIWFWVFFCHFLLNVRCVFKINENIVNFFKVKNTYLFFIIYYLFEFPYIYSFYIFYNCFNILFNFKNKENKIYNYRFIILITFLIKFIFYIIFSFTYFSVNTSINITNKFFNIFKNLDFINFNNKFKNFILNIIYLSSNITHFVFNSKLYFNNRRDIVFNPPKPILPEFDNIVNKMLRVNNALDYVFASYVDAQSQKIFGRYQLNINVHNEFTNKYDILALRFTKHPELKIFKINPNSKYLESEKINLDFFCKSIIDKNKYHWAIHPVLEKSSDISYYDPDKSLSFFKEALINSDHTLIALSSLVAGLHKHVDISKAGEIYKPENIIKVKTLHEYIMDSNFNLFVDPRFNDIVYETVAFVEAGVQKWGKEEFSNILKNAANMHYKQTVSELILFLLKDYE